MSVEPFTTKFSNIAQQVFLRCDPKYRYFWDNKKGISIEQNSLPNVKLKDILLPCNKKTLRKGELEEERPILELSDVESRTSLILQERLVTEIGSDKLDFADCTLVFNRLEPYLGKIVINDKSKRYVGTTEWIPLRLDPEQVRPTFLKYLLLLHYFLRSFVLLKSGKRHARIALVDLHNIAVPLPSKEKQAEIEKRVTPIEERMVSLQQSLAKPLDIVNRVFAREFEYDLEVYEKLAMQHTYQKAFSDLDKSFLLRSSVKFQHPKYEYVDRVLSRYTWVKLKMCALPIHRGIQPIYSENGAIYAIKTANLKNGYIDLTEAQLVDTEFYQANKCVAGIQRDDVLIASTGVGSIGKVDIWQSEEKAMADGHVSIVRINNKSMNPLYVTYYLRSILGYLQIQRDLSGSTNQIEVYPSQLEQMRIINLPRKEQDLIVDEVRAELHEIQKQRTEIHELRDQIDDIFQRTLFAGASGPLSN